MIDERLLYRALGQRLRELRLAQETSAGPLTQSRLADEIGLVRTSITNIERGNQNVPLHVLYRICEVLQVPVSEVLPAPADASPASASFETTPMEFGGRTASVTPKVRDTLARLLNSTESQ